MELLQFEVTNAGTLGSRWTPPAPETKKASSLPGAALAALLQEEDDEDDWGGDAPDMSAEFARLSHLNEESDTDALPLTADFAPLPDGSLALVRWPRLARPAVVPDTVEGRTVTAIAATAFAASHLDEGCFAQFGQSPISFSIFCMRMGRAVTTETLDEGGPTSGQHHPHWSLRVLPLHKSDFHHPAGCHFRPACRCIRRLQPPYQRPSAGAAAGSGLSAPPHGSDHARCRHVCRVSCPETADAASTA